MNTTDKINLLFDMTHPFTHNIGDDSGNDHENNIRKLKASLKIINGYCFLGKKDLLLMMASALGLKYQSSVNIHQICQDLTDIVETILDDIDSDNNN